MNGGAFGENFPYSNFHDLNMDWIIQIAKDFLDQYTHIQEIIQNGEDSIQQMTADGIEQLQTEGTRIQGLLQDWYDTHSEDIAEQLAVALSNLENWYTTHQGYLDTYLTESISAFNRAADQKTAESLASIPADYTSLSNSVDILRKAFEYYLYDNSIVRPYMFYRGAYYNQETPQMNNDYCYTKMFAVSPSTEYSVTSSGAYFVVAYDSNQAFISTVVQGQPATFTTPSNAAYIRVSAHVNRFADLKVWKSSDLLYISNDFKKVLHAHDYEIFGNATLTAIADLNDAPVNVQIIVQATSDTTVANLPSDYPRTGSLGFLNTYEAYYSMNQQSQRVQTLLNYPAGYIWMRSRLYDGGTPTEAWRAWTKFAVNNPDVIIGPGQQYTTLRDGFARAATLSNCTVHVMPGTYNLATEFADVIANQSGRGLYIGNNNHYIFHAGSFVKALFDNTDPWVYESFEPFYINPAGDANFTLEGLNIEASNTRYCVHDEMSGVGTAIHKYINCIMVYTNTHTDIKYVQCIGGGLGEHTTVIIEGGSYRSINSIGIPSVQNGDPLYAQQPISYHNGNSSGSYSHVFIKDVYLSDRGYFRFGGYGESTQNSRIYISNCRCGLPPLIRKETPTTPYMNFNTAFWNNDIAQQGTWVLAENGYTATFNN